MVFVYYLLPFATRSVLIVDLVICVLGVVLYCLGRRTEPVMALDPVASSKTGDRIFVSLCVDNSPCGLAQRPVVGRNSSQTQRFVQKALGLVSHCRVFCAARLQRALCFRIILQQARRGESSRSLHCTVRRESGTRI